MSHTLNKLKQSEIDHGLRKRPDKRKKTSSHGLLITYFVVIITGLLVFLNSGKDFFSQQLSSLSDQVAVSSKEVPAELELKQPETKHVADENKGVAAFITPVKEKDLKINVASTKKSDSSKQKGIEAVQDKKITTESNKKPTNLILNRPVKKTIIVKTVPVTAKNKKLAVKSSKQPVLWKNLSSSFKDSMPEMELNAIIFSKKESDRYVFVNMIKYHVKDVVESGPTIEEISENFIVLHYENKQFTLPLK